jgi:biopolymer transport protein ExbB
MQAAPAGSNPYGLIPALQQGGIIAISVFAILV